MTYLALQGFDCILATTIAAYGSDKTSIADIAAQKKQWMAMRQGPESITEFICAIETEYRELLRMCQLLDHTERSPRLHEMMDILERGAEPEIVKLAIYKLTVIKEMRRDKFTYRDMKTALLAAQGAMRIVSPATQGAMD